MNDQTARLKRKSRAPTASRDGYHIENMPGAGYAESNNVAHFVIVNPPGRTLKSSEPLRRTPDRERWITKRPEEAHEHLATKLTKVVAELSTLPKAKRIALLTKCGLQELPVSAPNRPRLAPHALPSGAPVPVPPSLKRVAELSSEELESRRARDRLKQRKIRENRKSLLTR